jgi:hypothetical protein
MSGLKIAGLEMARTGDAHECPQNMEKELWVNKAGLASEEAAPARGLGVIARTPGDRERN